MNTHWKDMFKVFIRIVIICSLTILTGLISLSGITTKITVIGVILAFGIYFTLEFKYKFIEKFFDDINNKYLGFSLMLTLLIIYFNTESIIWRWSKELLDICIKHNIQFINDSNVKKIIILGICFSSIAICILVYYLIQNVITYLKEFYEILDRVDKIYLIIWTSFLAVCIIVLYAKTTAFYSPIYIVENIKKMAPWDVIYSLDTPDILANNYLMDVYYGDLGHIFFSLIMLPFGVILKTLSSIYNTPNVFVIFLVIFNILILNMSAVLVKKILNTNWMLLLISLSHPFLVFSLSSERYQLTTFSIILFVYFCINKNYKDRVRIMPILGGTTITNIALIPFIEDLRVKSRLVTAVFKSAYIFVIVIILSGRIGTIITSIAQLTGKMATHAKPIPFLEKLNQYSSFITSCIFATPYKIINVNYPAFTWEQGSLSIVGILILVFILVSFYLNRNEKYAQICFYWIIISFILLPVAGWGAGEFQLFSIFFGWAVISLLYMGIERLCKGNCRYKTIIMVFIIINMMIINFKAIYDLIEFTMNYYPIMR